MIDVLLTFIFNNVRIQENQLTAFCRLTQEIHKTYILDSIRRGAQVNCEKTWNTMERNDKCFGTPEDSYKAARFFTESLYRQ